MNVEALLPLLAVVIGGLLSIAGGMVSTLWIENRRRWTESYHLALAFKGEICALLEHVAERSYLGRFSEVIAQIESSGEPFYLAFHMRFAYDRVYENNVERIGLLKPPLPEKIPIFYTRLTAILEDMVNLGEGKYAHLDLQILLRIYRDLHRLLGLSIDLGNEIVAEIDRLYG